MIQPEIFFRFGSALAIGFLIGLQREHTRREHLFAGIRTFPLIALLGCTAAAMVDFMQTPLVFLGALLVVGVLITISYAASTQTGDIGLTTEVAGILTFLLGGLCYEGELVLAAALAVVMTGLLSLKIELHRFTQRLTQEDIYAILKFATITAIILPILPNQTFAFDPLDVFNPYKTWIFVILISGISFLGYVLMKVLGSPQGIGLTGLLGGIVSSTAVTLSFSQKSHEQPKLSRAFALAIVTAWAMMFVSILVEVAILNQALLRIVWLPLTIAGIATLACSLYLYHTTTLQALDYPTVANPFALRSAITFGFIYTVVIIVSKAAQVYVGNAGIYISSGLAGLTGADAVTLSMTELSQSGDLDLTVAARAIVLAATTNTLGKGLLVVLTGEPTLRTIILPSFILVLVVSVSTLFLL